MLDLKVVFFNISHEATFPELLQRLLLIPQLIRPQHCLFLFSQSVNLNLHILHYPNDTSVNVAFGMKRWIFPRAPTETERDGKQKPKKKGRKKRGEAEKTPVLSLFGLP